MGLTIEKARVVLEQLFVLYSEKFSTGGDQRQPQQQQSSRSSSKPINASWNSINNSRHHSSSSSSQTSSSELVKYLENECYIENSDKLDILEWWKNKQGRFSTRSLVA